MGSFSEILLSSFSSTEKEKLKKIKVGKLPDLPQTSSLLSPDFKEKRAHADAKFNAFEKGFELAKKKSEKD